ncbi:TadE/TadG family type IV pilus assembly protein [Agrobacterium rosae]|uniref:TadE/TadG family type IV pilus assembly protein n=1 Tax=Agrobacterium rosae TaxID=1972867 RepID=UPI0020349688
MPASPKSPIAKQLSNAFFRNMQCSGGNFGVLSALVFPILIATAGGAVDIYGAFTEKAHLQEKLDSGVLAAAVEPTPSGQRLQIENFLADLAGNDGEAVDFQKTLSVISNTDGSVTGTFNAQFVPSFLSLVGIDLLPISVSSTAIAPKSKAPSTCIYVLGNTNQAVLVNSGAAVKAPSCGVDVSSVSNPAFIMNSGSTIETARFCVKGRQYIKNGGTLSNLQVGCDAASDPYIGKMIEPKVPSSCTTSGTKDGATVSLKPGLHCDVTFNGSPTITFEPGLHVVKGRMIINSNAKVKAEGVTFYFPDVDSEIRANGGLSFTASAPASGTYKGILMFEKTSGASPGTNTRQYIFNGSKGETLDGVIYLPNRDVTYNSTTNQANKISLVVNTMIINSANWALEPYDGGGTSAKGVVRLVK